MSSTFGKIFKISTFGESHGKAIGVVIDGCPSGISLEIEDIQRELDRRKPGQSEVVTPRSEADTVEIYSGVFEGKTTGTPIMLLIKNKDQKSNDYSNLKDIFRPSHADYVYQAKYGIRDYKGGGRSSARETAARVAAGAIAQKILKEIGIHIFSFVEQIGDLTCEIEDVNREIIDSNIVRCPDPQTASKMINLIKEVAADGDTVGGVVKTIIKGVPVGLGEPVFDKLQADFAKAMMSINAAKGFEYGLGFDCVKMRGSQHNDQFETVDGKVKTITNNSGGIQGGISNGEDIYFRTAFKPVATIMKEQKTVNKKGEETFFRAHGRHDACVLPRAVPIVDAMSALVLLDHVLLAKTTKIL